MFKRTLPCLALPCLALPHTVVYVMCVCNSQNTKSISACNVRTLTITKYGTLAIQGSFAVIADQIRVEGSISAVNPSTKGLGVGTGGTSCSGGGGGGGLGSAGIAGKGGCKGGAAFGIDFPAEMPLGGAGGAPNSGRGGAGGGSISLVANVIVGSGTLKADGAAGSANGGGGAGGSIHLAFARSAPRTSEISQAGTSKQTMRVTVAGGKGNGNGGNGGKGRVSVTQFGFCKMATKVNPLYCTHNAPTMAYGGLQKCLDGTKAGQAPLCVDGSPACCCDSDGMSPNTRSQPPPPYTNDHA